MHILRGPVDEGTYLWTRIARGTVLFWFLVFCLRNPEYFRNGCGLLPNLWIQKNSSNLDKLPGIRLSVLLISRDKFFVTLFAISDTWVIKSLLILARTVFRHWLLLSCSSWLSLLPTSGCAWLMPIFWRKNNQRVFKAELPFYFFINLGEQEKMRLLTISAVIFFHIRILVSPHNNLFSERKITVYTPSEGTM